MNLAPNIYVVRIDHRSVVLDLNRDRYIGLNADLSDALQNLSSSPHKDRQDTADGRAIAKLLHQGLVTHQGQPECHSASPPAAASQATLPQPTASLWALLSDERTSGAPISAAAMMSALVSLTQVSISLRFRPFKSTVDWLSTTKTLVPRRRAERRAEARESAQALVDAFDEVRPYFPLKPICRLDAPALCLHLRRNGREAHLVFGVRLDPFAAHCWVQIGEVAVSEPWARVRRFTPVLIV